MSARGAAPKLRSAPIFVSASTAPAGNAAVAKNRETVKPIAAVMPMTTKSARRSPCGTRAPANRAAPENNRMPIGLPREKSGEHEVGARPNLFERHAGSRQAKQEQGMGFDLTPSPSPRNGGLLDAAPGMVGMVIGFLFLDERDARTLTALRTTPMSMHLYLGYRIALPLLLGTASTLIGYPLTGLTPLPLSALLPIAIVAGVSAPILALVLAIAAPNKVAGFAVVKVMNAVNLLPVVAYFVPRRFSSLQEYSDVLADAGLVVRGDR